jgi:YoeB-like toxin of bacterial type II toxin-antitoxin system
MSAEDYESLHETLHLFSTRANAVHILRGLAEAREGAAEPTGLEGWPPGSTCRQTGTGKPERLKHLGGEVWSRRMTEKDRLVYDIQSDVITIIACRFHYDDH